MAGDSIQDRTKENASGIVAMVVTGTWLAMLMLGVSSSIWLAFMLFGYIVVVPVVAILFDEEEVYSIESTSSVEQGQEKTDEETPLERLRRRYAEGELTDEQFERKLERLLETETLEDAVEHRARSEKERLRDKEFE